MQFHRKFDIIYGILWGLVFLASIIFVYCIFKSDGKLINTIKNFRITFAYFSNNSLKCKKLVKILIKNYLDVKNLADNSLERHKLMFNPECCPTDRPSCCGMSTGAPQTKRDLQFIDYQRSCCMPSQHNKCCD